MSRSKPIPSDILTKIRRDFVLGKASIASLSELYGVNKQCVYLVSQTEKWASLQPNYERVDEVLTLHDQITALNTEIAQMIAEKPDGWARDLDSLYRSKQRAASMLGELTAAPKRPQGRLAKEKNPEREAMMKRLASRATKPKAVVPEPNQSQTVVSTEVKAE